MASLVKLMLSSILITVIVLGLSSPVAAQPPSPTIYVEAPDSVIVSTEFDIVISIHDIPNGYGMIGLALALQWNPNDLEYIECEFLYVGKPGWNVGCISTSPGEASAGGGGPAWTADAEWFRFRFHCLRSGPAPITVSSPDGIDLKEDFDGSPTVFPEPVTVTVNQVAPVGGIVTPVDKFEVLTPYLALAGLIAVVSAVYVIKKRKD